MTLTAATRDDHGTSRGQGHRRRGIQPSRRMTGPDCSLGTTRSLHASGLRGELWFRLQRNQGGLYVEREELPRRGMPCVQSVHFRDAHDFDRWCDDDPARFEHPLLHIDLKRDAARLWQLGERNAGDG